MNTDITNLTHDQKIARASHRIRVVWSHRYGPIEGGPRSASDFNDDDVRYNAEIAVLLFATGPGLRDIADDRILGRKRRIANLRQLGFDAAEVATMITDGLVFDDEFTAGETIALLETHVATEMLADQILDFDGLTSVSHGLGDHPFQFCFYDEESEREYTHTFAVDSKDVINRQLEIISRYFAS